ncbi:hypothetical protein JB92DRAFT_3109818 [Gautieria morchelliformis]|nr:hypothetical protein JB92DRAFT_3109818 [Gautieria morchelliformis]
MFGVICDSPVVPSPVMPTPCHHLLGVDIPEGFYSDDPDLKHYDPDCPWHVSKKRHARGYKQLVTYDPIGDLRKRVTNEYLAQSPSRSANNPALGLALAAAQNEYLAAEQERAR